MTKKELLDEIQKRVDELNEEYNSKEQELDSIDRAIILGKVNAYLNAKLLVYDLEEINKCVESI